MPYIVSLTWNTRLSLLSCCGSFTRVCQPTSCKDHLTYGMIIPLLPTRNVPHGTRDATSVQIFRYNLIVRTRNVPLGERSPRPRIAETRSRTFRGLNSNLQISNSGAMQQCINRCEANLAQNFPMSTLDKNECFALS